jgi:hypothetical protein
MQRKAWFIGIIALASFGSLATTGCGSSRDVEVSGTVSSPSTSQGKIVVAFYDNKDDSWSEVHSIELAQPGAFSEKVSIEGDQVRVRAFADTDANGKCTGGEAWEQAETDIADDDTASVSLSLTSTASCPSD